RGEDHDGVVGLADVVQVLQQSADAVVHLGHAGLFQAVVALGVHHGLILRRDVGEDMHAGSVMPNEEWLAVFLGLVHKAVGVLDEHFIEGLHVVLGFAALLPVLEAFHVGKRRQRTLIHNSLLADLPPTWHCRSIIDTRRPAVNQIARPGLVDPVLGIVIPVGI